MLFSPARGEGTDGGERNVTVDVTLPTLYPVAALTIFERGRKSEEREEREQREERGEKGRENEREGGRMRE